MMRMNDKKRRIIAGVIAILLIAAMVIPTVIGMLM